MSVRAIRQFRECLDAGPTVATVQRLVADLQDEDADRDVLKAARELLGELRAAQALRARAALGAPKRMVH